MVLRSGYHACVPFCRAFVSARQWQQLPHRLAAGNQRIIHATAGELKRIPAQIRQRHRQLLAEDKADRGGRPAFRPTSKHVLNPLSNWVHPLLKGSRLALNAD